MLSGKAVSRAVRGFMLVDSALQTLISEETFGVDLIQDENMNVDDAGDNTLSKACDLYDKVIKKEISIDQMLESECFKTIETLVNEKKKDLEKSRTSKVWLCFSEMVAILKRFLLAKRTGNWILHLHYNKCYPT